MLRVEHLRQARHRVATLKARHRRNRVGRGRPVVHLRVRASRDRQLGRRDHARGVIHQAHDVVVAAVAVVDRVARHAQCLARAHVLRVVRLAQLGHCV